MYFTARREGDGVAVRGELTASGRRNIDFQLFDLANPDDPASISQAIESRHGGIDVVIQNGAYMPRAGHVAADDARPMIAANSHGTLRVMTAFLPILREDAQTPEQAADGLMKLIVEDGIGSQVHGELVQHGKVIPFIE